MAASVKFAAIEEKVAYFHRERMSPAVHQANIRLKPGQTSEFHLHTVTRDTFYILEGALEVRVVCRDEYPREAYQTLGEPTVVTEKCRGGFLHRVTLLPGDVMVVLPKAVHASANTTESECSFICLEGPGEYDFIRCPNVIDGDQHAIQSV